MARFNEEKKMLSLNDSSPNPPPIKLLFRFTSLRRMRVPGAARLRLDVGEPGAGRRIGDADEMLAGRALDLASGVAWVARKRLIAVRTIEFKFSRVHKLLAIQKPRAHGAQTRHEMHTKINECFLSGQSALKND
jgi:hypothetical protein